MEECITNVKICWPMNSGTRLLKLIQFRKINNDADRPVFNTSIPQSILAIIKAFAHERKKLSKVTVDKLPFTEDYLFEKKHFSLDLSWVNILEQQYLSVPCGHFNSKILPILHCILL